MLRIEILQRQPAFNEGRCSKLLATQCHLSLRDAKDVTAAIVQKRRCSVNVFTLDDARSVIVALAELGVTARIERQAGYDPTERARQVLSAFAAFLAPDVARSCVTLIDIGEGATALGVIARNAGDGETVPPDAASALLADVAVEFGVVSQGRVQ